MPGGGPMIDPDIIERAARHHYERVEAITAGRDAFDWSSLSERSRGIQEEATEDALLAVSEEIDCPARVLAFYDRTIPDEEVGPQLVHPGDCDACGGSGTLRVIR